MTTTTELDEHKVIAFAHLIAQGEIPISDPTLERIARMHRFEDEDRLMLAEKHMRNLVRLLLSCLDSTERPSIIKFFSQVYQHEGKATI